MAAGSGAALHRRPRCGLLVRIVAQRALRVVRIIPGELVGHQPAHLMTAEALARLRGEHVREAVGRQVRTRHRAGEIVTQRTVQCELAHFAQANLQLFVAARLTTGFFGGCKFVHAARVALDALHTAQCRIVRLQMNAMACGVGDLRPFLRVTSDVTPLAFFVRDDSVLLQFVRALDDLRQRHLAACDQRRFMAGFTT